MIKIIDYGMGNLRSVSKALDFLGLDNEIVETPQALAGADRMILPGVGAFGDAMKELHARGLVEPIMEHLDAGRPLLGICLGMQLVMEWSEESPGVEGLGIIPGGCRKFQIGLKVPQMGWNRVKPVTDCPLFKGLSEEDYFYFVHSFYVDPEGEGKAAAAGITDYEIEYPSVLWRENLVATQFHPEKSQQRGLTMLTNFSKM